MKKTEKWTPMRLISLLLAAILLVGAMPFNAFAKEADTGIAAEPTASEERIVIAYGGIIKSEKSAVPFDGTAAPGTAVRITLDEAAFPGHTFDGFLDDNGNKLYYKSYTSITVQQDMTYSAAYEPNTIIETTYVGVQATNGSVTMDGEEFYGGSFEPGTELTLTTTGNDGYPYFLGWYLMDEKTGEGNELISKDLTLHYTVTEYAEIVARWSRTEVEKKHNITAVNGFLRSGYERLAVSAVSVADDRDVMVIKDPTNPLKVKEWVLTGTLDDGTKVRESRELSEYGNGFYISENQNDGKGYPWDITITGEADICTEHIWDGGVVTKEPTYVDYGEMTYTCTVCGTQNVTIDFTHNGSGSITPNVYTVLDVGQTDNPYVQYVLRAAEGYDVAEIYDISFTDADGNKYTPAAGESVTVTLTVGAANARAVADGRMNIIHITDNGNVIYGLGHEPITANVDAGTVTFTVDSFSPFVLARQAIEYYGRAAVANMQNSTALLYAYDQIVAGIGASKAEISVYNDTDVITQDELKTVFDAYRFDHTEHFWLGNSYSIRYTGSTVTSLIPSYIMSGTELEAAKAEFNAAAAELLSGITSSMSEYEREKELHDRLAAKISYEFTGNAHNAYGALAEGKAVCEGYAEAYQYLLQLAGLQSFIVTGTSKNPSTGTPEGHAWNIVRVDGKYYHVDLTWNDQGERLFYAYFNKTDDCIKVDHAIDDTAYDLPVCNSETADYFTVNGGKMESFNAQTVGTMLKNGGGTARVYVTGDKTAFIEAFKTNIRTVAQYAEISGGFTYGFANLGEEFILTLSKVGVTVSGTATSFGSDTDDVKIELIPSGATAAKYSITVSGKNTTYSIPNVEAGTYTLRVSKKNHVTREYTVTVGNTDVEQDVKIHLPGDIDGNGAITIMDAIRANSHVRGVTLLTDYALKCADVVGTDGTVTNMDVIRINAHAKGMSLLW